MRRVGPTLGVTALLALAPATAASASTVSIVPSGGGSQVLFNASPGLANKVTVHSIGTTYVVSDLAGSVLPGAGCSASGPSAIACPQAGVGSIRVVLGDGDDTVTNGASQNLVAEGGDGNDTLNGGPQGDQLRGDGGDDTMTGNGGADRFEGGAGTDTVSYAGRSQPVRVDLDGGYDDGAADEFDNVGSDVEQVLGGAGDDTFVGGPGRDVFRGGSGNDSLDGMDGDDELYGDAGNDRLEGRSGKDTFAGGDGDDTVSARDNGTGESVDCGAGNDSATADREDTASGCEKLDAPQAPPAWNFPAPQAPIANVVTIVQRTVTVDRNGAVSIRLSCGDDQVKGCKGDVTLTAKVPSAGARASRRSGPANKIVLARQRFRLRRGRTAAVRAKARKAALRKVFTKGRRQVKATMAVTMRNSDGSKTTITKTVTVSAASLRL